MLNDDARMQILISDATDLKTHLKEDGFFNCGDTLHIIDNYNILNIKPYESCLILWITILKEFDDKFEFY